jgi:hypothetical protein
MVRPLFYQDSRRTTIAAFYSDHLASSRGAGAFCISTLGFQVLTPTQQDKTLTRYLAHNLEERAPSFSA